MTAGTRLRALRRDRSGVTTVEFALLCPVLFVMVLGGLEMSHTLYVDTVLTGQLQKAARDMSLEGASASAQQTAIEQTVTNMVHQIIPSAQVTYDVKSYHDYTNAKSPAEEFHDTDIDGICDHGESFVDSNSNGHWDADGSVAGRGGAKDVMLMTAHVSYTRFFLNAGQVNLSATTLLRNQPSQNQADPPMGTCP